MHTNFLATALVATTCLSTLSSAWYLEVHNQIGYMADTLITPQGKFMVEKILEDEYKGSIGRAAAWADTVSRTTAKYSYGWHWISARDDPPDNCNLHYHRDCQDGGCVVQQIHNQTRILRPCVQSLAKGTYTEPDIDCQQALKWIIHFIGDVSEPMHTSIRALGGNGFKVLFNGTETNMHQVWDRWILYSQSGHLDGFSGSSIDPYFENLLARIQRDDFRIPRSEWALCDFEHDIHRATYCPERWASDSNAIVCDYAYGRYENGTDLLTSGYAKGAFHIVEVQLVKAAWRLAGWLNAIARESLGAVVVDVVEDMVVGENDVLADVRGGENAERFLLQQPNGL